MRVLVTAGLCSLMVASGAAAQVVRVSVSTDGTEANASSGAPSISMSGRFVVFVSSATNLVADDTNGVADVFLRDRDTDADGAFDEPGAVATTRISVGSGGVQLDRPSVGPLSITPDGRYVVFISEATNLLPGAPVGTRQIYRLDRQTGDVVRVSQTTGGAAADLGARAPAMSADGDVVVFLSDANNLPRRLVTCAYVRRISIGQTTLLPVPPDMDGFADFVSAFVYGQPSISADGTRVMFLTGYHALGSGGFFRGYVADLRSGALTKMAPSDVNGLDGIKMSLTASGESAIVSFVPGTYPTFPPPQLYRVAIATGAQTAARVVPGAAVGSSTGRYAYVAQPNLMGRALYDFDFDVVVPFPFGFVSFAPDDRWLGLGSADSTLTPGATNGVDDAFVFDLPDYLDADNDTMDDRWETLFGITDPAADPDGDGQTNAQEEDAGTHPNGQVRRFLAEGATGAFFHTKIALANPDPALPATAVLTFDRGDGTRRRQAIAIPAGRSALVDVGAVTGFEAADVSTTIESDRLLGIQRTMSWGSSPTVPPYGSHAESAAPAPSTTWFLAEGTTVVDFNLFYLLQNPQTTSTQATVRFLLPSGTTITRTYDLPPGSRTTIYVNQIAGLEETDVSGDISADAPIVVERAMYRSRPGEPFALGTDSMGVTAPATAWFLAEGATGPFFDLYVLIANPGSTDATVRADYALADGSVVTQTYTVRAHSRFSVFVDSIPGLANTPVATTLTSTNAVPIVAERVMYWPGGFFDYYEGHSSSGSTSTALEWVVAGGLPGGLPDDAQTYVLIANTSNVAGQATLDVLLDRDATVPAPAPLVVQLPATSRTTVPISGGGGPFGVRVRSTGASPVQLVVESAVYSSGSATWAAGSSALATPVP